MIFSILYRKNSYTKNPVFEMAQGVGTEWGGGKSEDSEPIVHTHT